jgi:hypothetical protein
MQCLLVSVCNSTGSPIEVDQLIKCPVNSSISTLWATTIHVQTPIENIDDNSFVKLILQTKASSTEFKDELIGYFIINKQTINSGLASIPFSSVESNETSKITRLSVKEQKIESKISSIITISHTF